VLANPVFALLLPVLARLIKMANSIAVRRAPMDIKMLQAVDILAVVVSAHQKRDVIDHVPLFRPSF
jgi:hypothetical protein